MISHPERPIDDRGGAYGLSLPERFFPGNRLVSLTGTEEPWRVESLVVTALDAPRARAHDVQADEAVVESYVDDHTAYVAFSDAMVTLTRAESTVSIVSTGPLDPELFAHPMLAAVGIVAAHWARRVPLHASAVILGGRAWGLLADRSVGKSTTNAALAAAGHGVLTDDLLVIDDQLQAHAGPRCIDLRRESASLFPHAEELHPTRDLGRDRFRITPADVPASVPLAGFVRLEWSTDATFTTPVRAVDRLPLIGSAYSVSAPMKNPRLSLELAALPMYVLARPQRLGAMPAAIDALESLAASVA